MVDTHGGRFGADYETERSIWRFKFGVLNLAFDKSMTVIGGWNIRALHRSRVESWHDVE